MERRPLSATDGYDNHSPLLSPSPSLRRRRRRWRLIVEWEKEEVEEEEERKNLALSLSLSRIGTFLVPSLREPSGIRPRPAPRIPPCGYNDWEADNGDSAPPPPEGGTETGVMGEGERQDDGKGEA